MTCCFLQSLVTSYSFAATGNDVTRYYFRILHKNYFMSVSTCDRTSCHSVHFTNPLLATLTK